MSWNTLRSCFPLSPQKKTEFIEQHIVKRLIDQNPHITEKNQFKNLPLNQRAILLNVLQKKTKPPSRLYTWYNNISNQVSKWLYNIITRHWDRGESVTLTPEEKADLLREYGYHFAEPPSQT